MPSLKLSSFLILYLFSVALGYHRTVLQDSLYEYSDHSTLNFFLPSCSPTLNLPRWNFTRADWSSFTSLALILSGFQKHMTLISSLTTVLSAVLSSVSICDRRFTTCYVPWWFPSRYMPLWLHYKIIKFPLPYLRFYCFRFVFVLNHQFPTPSLLTTPRSNFQY